MTVFTTFKLTMGQVAFSLLDTNGIEKGILCFSTDVDSETEQGGGWAIFRKEDNYFLVNHSSKIEDILTLSFPQNENGKSVTVIIPPMMMVNLTYLFHDEALCDNSKFMLSAGSKSQNCEPDKTPDEFIITETCSHVSVPSRQCIGHYLDVNVQPHQFTLKSHDDKQLILVGVPALRVQSNGDTGMLFANIQAKAGQVVVNFPKQLSTSQMVSIEIMAQMQLAVQLEQLVANDIYAHLRTKVDEDTIARLEKAPKLNWR